MTIHRRNQEVLFTGPVTMPGGETQTDTGDEVIPGDEIIRGQSNPKGKVTCEDVYELAPYTVLTAPDATVQAGEIIYVSNGADGDPVPAFSDGTNWLRWDDRTVIADPNAPDSVIDFQAQTANIDGNSRTMAQILGVTSALDADGLDFANTSSAVSAIGDLLTKFLTLDYIVFIEWYDTGSALAGNLAFIEGNGGSDYLQIYRATSGGGRWPEADENTTSSGDWRSVRDAATINTSAVNKMAIAVTSTYYLGSINGTTMADVGGLQARTGAAPIVTTATFGGSDGGSASHDLQIRKVNFYPAQNNQTFLNTLTT